MDFKKLVLDLAALMYFEKPKMKEEDGKKSSPVRFEDLTEAEQKPYLDRAKKIPVYLEKLNMVVVEAKELKLTSAAREARVEDLKRTIGSFVKGLKHPKGIDRFFPVAELANRIAGIE